MEKVGYSEKINDPAYQVEEKKSSSLKYMLFIVPLAVLVLLWRSGVLATWVFAALMLLTVLAALPPVLKESRLAADKTYDGVIDSVERREPVTQANIGRVDATTRDKMILHTIRIRDGENQLHTYERMGGVGADYAQYYRPGDSVRHHRGFDLPEKYDKSADEEIVCIACGRMNSMDSRRCGTCSAPLLK